MEVRFDYEKNLQISIDDEGLSLLHLEHGEAVHMTWREVFVLLREHAARR